jgi:hypothetical protein
VLHRDLDGEHRLMLYEIWEDHKGMTRCIDHETPAPTTAPAIRAPGQDVRRTGRDPMRESLLRLPPAHEIQAGETDHIRRIAIGLAALAVVLARALASSG